MEQLLAVARDVAGAAAELHRAGITHGDMYAHNILVPKSGATEEAAVGGTAGQGSKPQGQEGGRPAAILSDLGAAFFYCDERTKSDETSRLVERIEALAFGHFLGELVSICRGWEDSETKRLMEVGKIVTDCRVARVADRPGFDEVVARLAAV